MKSMIVLSRDWHVTMIGLKQQHERRRLMVPWNTKSTEYCCVMYIRKSKCMNVNAKNSTSSQCSNGLTVHGRTDIQRSQDDVIEQLRAWLMRSNIVNKTQITATLKAEARLVESAAGSFKYRGIISCIRGKTTRTAGRPRLWKTAG